jgi:hypothetical protein
MKRCSIVSRELHEQHFKLPFQFRFARLSLVRVTPFFIYHKKILILNGTLIFQMGHLRGITPLLISAIYIDLVEKIPLLCKFQMKTSFASVSLVARTFSTNPYHDCRLCPLNACRNDMFNGIVLSTSATVTCFFLANW